MKRFLLFCLVLIPFSFCRSENNITSDSIPVPADSLAPLHGNWFQQLVRTGFQINDPRISYPRFPRFCLKVYNWGDRTFNSYDPAYVRSTGKNWKISVKSDNWNQSYRYVFSLFDQNNVSVRSRVSSDLGISLNFMAVGISYTRALDELFYGKKNKRNSLDFSFTCSRFSVELLSQQTEGGAYIDRYGDYENGKFLHMPFDGLSQSQTSVTAFYFFNHNRYSQSAAYAYSKYQLRSAGSWIGGFRWAHRRIVMDFSDLPDDMKEANPDFPLINTFNYNEYSLLGGYAHNFVLNRHFLYNITAMPCVGYRNSELHTDSRGRREMISANMIGRMSLTYNNRMLFCGIVAKFNGGFILNKNFSFFNSTQYATAIVGVRF
ncbi:MAG: DUF4421 domain-containing protein [Muribaculaceae bacterium]|nr:DUF4421 domain-containing protein [Muribaculaceae bacterium]